MLAVFVTHEETAFEKSQESFHGKLMFEAEAFRLKVMTRVVHVSSL